MAVAVSGAGAEIMVKVGARIKKFRLRNTGINHWKLHISVQQGPKFLAVLRSRACLQILELHAPPDLNSDQNFFN